MRLLEPLALGRRRAPNRVMFGPHETNLSWGRSLSERHVAYYAERAEGGCGTIVVEEASVHASDWPYERSPSAAEAEPGWTRIVDACRPSGSLVIGALGHSGGQGGSAYSQRELWAPSDEPEVNTNEVPKIMEIEDIEAVVDGFHRSASTAAAAGLDGVEVNAGQHSLVRQFLSGLTNRRDDEYGHDRLRFAREVLLAARSGLDDDQVLGLRLSCDELAPWAGLTPEAAVEVARGLAPHVDYLVVVRGSIFSVAETRPTGHHGEGFAIDLAATIRAGIAAELGDEASAPPPVFAQGSIVEPDQAEAAIVDERCDGVEMTRAQIAEPALVAKLADGRPVRPCLLCNQRCSVRDNRNPIISCVVEPRAGHETTDPVVPESVDHESGSTSLDVLIVGAGPAGLEAARVAAHSGHQVTVIDADANPGGRGRTVARAPGHHRFGRFIEWLAADAVAAGANLRLGESVGVELVDSWAGPVILATGGRADSPRYDIRAPMANALADAGEVAAPGGVVVLDSAAVLDCDLASATVPADVVIWDPIGNSVGVAVAELLAGAGRAVTFVTPDAVAGTQLSLTGDLAGANVRLQQAGVTILRRHRLRSVDAAAVTLEHALSGEISTIATRAVIDCGAHLPDDRLAASAERATIRVGDAVAPRTMAEAIREGRAAALSLYHQPDRRAAPDRSTTP